MSGEEFVSGWDKSRRLKRKLRTIRLRTNGVNTNGAAAKVISFDRFGEKTTPWHFWEIKSRLTGVPKKSLCQKTRNLQRPHSCWLNLSLSERSRVMNVFPLVDRLKLGLLLRTGCPSMPESRSKSVVERTKKAPPRLVLCVSQALRIVHARTVRRINVAVEESLLVRKRPRSVTSATDDNNKKKTNNKQANNNNNNNNNDNNNDNKMMKNSNNEKRLSALDGELHGREGRLGRELPLVLRP